MLKIKAGDNKFRYLPPVFRYIPVTRNCYVYVYCIINPKAEGQDRGRMLLRLSTFRLWHL